jgi:hypothetical protein
MRVFKIVRRLKGLRSLLTTPNPNHRIQHVPDLKIAHMGGLRSLLTTVLLSAASLVNVGLLLALVKYKNKIKK